MWRQMPLSHTRAVACILRASFTRSAYQWLWSVAAGGDQQDMVGIHEHQFALDGGGLAGAAEKCGGGVRHRDEFRRKMRKHRVQRGALRQVKVGAHRKAVGMDLDVMTLFRHSKIGGRVDGHLVQRLPERAAVVFVDLRAAFDRFRGWLADQFDPGLVDQVFRHRALLGRRGHRALGREFDARQPEEALSLVDEVAESNGRRQSQPPDRSEERAVDLDQEFAVGKDDWLKGACRIDSHTYVYGARG